MTRKSGPNCGSILAFDTTVWLSIRYVGQIGPFPVTPLKRLYAGADKMDYGEMGKRSDYVGLNGN